MAVVNLRIGDIHDCSVMEHDRRDWKSACMDGEIQGDCIGSDWTGYTAVISVTTSIGASIKHNVWPGGRQVCLINLSTGTYNISTYPKMLNWMLGSCTDIYYIPNPSSWNSSYTLFIYLQNCILLLPTSSFRYNTSTRIGKKSIESSI